jgi:hypothetical protein
VKVSRENNIVWLSALNRRDVMYPEQLQYQGEEACQ